MRTRPRPFRAALAASPEVERFEYVYTIAATVVLDDGAALTFDQAAPLILGSSTVGGRLKVLDGQLPDETSSDEMVVTAVTADRLGLGPGDAVSLATDDGVVPMRVAAVVAAASEFPTVGGRTLSFLAAMPGFLEAHPDLVAPYDSTAGVWLRDGAEGLAALRARGDELGFGDLDLDDQAEVTRGVNRILRTDAVALVIAGLLAAVVGAAILHQLLRREADSVAGDLRTLGTLGVTRAGRAAGGALAGGFIGGVGAVAGVAVRGRVVVVHPLRCRPPRRARSRAGGRRHRARGLPGRRHWPSPASSAPGVWSGPGGR